MDYSKHFLLNKETVKQYVLDKTDVFKDKTAEELDSAEVSDGNINYVFKVFTADQSVIVKQSDNKIRTSGRKLDMHRSILEDRILSVERQLTGNMVPEVYDYDDIMSVIVMEDISEFHNLRSELAKRHTYSDFAEQISSFLVNSLLPTTDLVMDRHEKKKAVRDFINIDLCDITEDLVLTEPYYDYKGRNVFGEGLKTFVEKNLYSNNELKANVGELRNNFMNNAQALLHGDLHTGSIFINDTGIRIIDPEFAFYGPMGYDIGNVIGNLIFPYVVNESNLADKDKKFASWLGKAISDIFNLVYEKLYLSFDKNVKFPLYRESTFRDQYIDHVMADSLGFAGTELIRRTVGDSKVPEISNIEDQAQKEAVSRVLINIGSSLILHRNEFFNGEKILSTVRSCVSWEMGAVNA